MIFDWFTPDYWVGLGHAESWATIVTGIFTAVGTIIAVILAALLTYLFTLKHSKVTHNTRIYAERLKRDIDALEHLWGLLGFMTFAESKNAIVRWREEEKGKKEYFVHVGNLRQFILIEVNDAFYKQHAGLYLPNHIRDQLFEYQGSLMGLYMRMENEEDDALIKIKSVHLVDKMRSAYQQLNNDLRVELESCYRQLSV